LTAGPGLLDQIGQIVFPLSIGSPDSLEGIEDEGAVGQVDAGIDLIQASQTSAGIRFFDDPLHHTLLVAHHPAVTLGLGQATGQKSHLGFFSGLFEPG
jgi:hypothetical protein